MKKDKEFREFVGCDGVRLPIEVQLHVAKLELDYNTPSIYYSIHQSMAPIKSTSHSRLKICLSILLITSVPAAVFGFSPFDTQIHSVKRRRPRTTRSSPSALHLIEEKIKKPFGFFLPKRVHNGAGIKKSQLATSHHADAKVRVKENFPKEMMKNRTDFEMAIMSTLAITVPAGVVISLAMSAEDTPKLVQETSNFFRDILSQSSGTILAEEGADILEDSIEQLGVTAYNVFDAAFPTSATDVVSIALGEGIAAGIGGVVTFAAGIGFKTKGLIQNGWGNVLADYNSTASRNEASVDGFIAGAVADTDYFITRAAAVPLLGALGLPSFLGVIVATVPSQLIKLSARQREQRLMEDELMETLLVEDKMKKRKPFFQFGFKEPAVAAQEVSIERPVRITPGSANQIDVVEIFGDVVKWLEYDVLVNQFTGMLGEIPSGLESFAFGFLAALSSQLWGDAIYRFTDYGLEFNREAARARSIKDSFTKYMLACASSATLFGVYESVRGPVSTVIAELLSGGVDSCLGSKDFNVCIETFMTYNPAEATAEGQARAFFVAAATLLARFDDFSLDGGVNGEEFAELVRAVAVQLYNLFT